MDEHDRSGAASSERLDDERGAEPSAGEDPGAPPEELRELLAGLRASPPRISPRYFYDREGSRLFDAITRTPEYYPTRTELALLRDHGDRVARHVAPGSVLVELGSGSADKALALLEHLERPRLYRPIDISRDALEQTARALIRARPELEISPYWGDFTAPAAYSNLPAGAQRLVYYSGSTIGNFERPEALAFLRALRERLSPGDVLVLGVDLVKDPAVLHAAYNDAAGVTAAFNKNVLRHLNARFGADFDLERFEHLAFYDERARRVEMHLVPTAPVVVSIAGERFGFDPTRPIHTESSHKFSERDLAELADGAGYRLIDIVTDERRWFAEALLGV